MNPRWLVPFYRRMVVSGFQVGQWTYDTCKQRRDARKLGPGHFRRLYGYLEYHWQKGRFIMVCLVVAAHFMGKWSYKMWSDISKRVVLEWCMIVFSTYSAVRPAVSWGASFWWVYTQNLSTSFCFVSPTSDINVINFQLVFCRTCWPIGDVGTFCHAHRIHVHLVNLCGKCIGKDTSPMDPMGWFVSSTILAKQTKIACLMTNDLLLCWL